VALEGQPWFVATDIYRILFGVTTGLSHVAARLDPEERRVVTRSEGIGFPLFQGSTAPHLQLVSESGLYKLIMRSDKPQAKAFQDWVTKEVLPASPEATA